MFAIVKTGGKQYRVAKDAIITVEKLAGEVGDTIALDNVLMIGDQGKAATIGTPTVNKAKVFTTLIKQTRGEKIIVFKKLRRKKHRLKKGHKQDLTVLKVLEVSPTGIAPKLESKSKTVTKPGAANQSSKTRTVAKTSKVGAEKSAQPAEKKPSSTKEKVAKTKQAPTKEKMKSNEVGIKKDSIKKKPK